jgi:peptidoglycan/LPS O-acetylase OafA/YrhL
VSSGRPATGYIVSTAFLFGAGYGALVIMGLGVIAVALNSDDPVSPFIGALAPIALILSGLTFIGSVMRRGFRRDNRLRWSPILLIALLTLAAYLVGVILVMVLFRRWNPASALTEIGQAVISPASTVVVLAAALSAWAYFGTLRWQARNAESRQFAHPQD